MCFFSKDRKLVKALRALLSEAVALGITEEGKREVEDYICHGEYWLALDQTVYELHENNISITAEVYQQIQDIGAMMKRSTDEYAYMKERIR